MKCPPTVAYKEGEDGIVIYFALADAKGELTTDNGIANIEVKKTLSNYIDGEYRSEDFDLFKTQIEVKSEYFKNASVGVGNFQHEMLILPIGRITYSQFKEQVESGNSGKVEVTFNSSATGRTIHGSAQINF